MKTKLDKRTWNTYRISCYSHDVADDQASAGGVHKHQVRRTSTGWQARILQSNGRHEAGGPADAISDSAGEAGFALAREY